MFQPYTRSTVLRFYGCGNMKALLSPASEFAMSSLVGTFVYQLITSGFEVTRTGERYDTMHRRFYEPGKPYGYTMGAILTSSDASVHTYPEDRFGQTYELDLNLCYLEAHCIERHDGAIANAERVFSAWLQASQVEVFPCDPRGFPAQVAQVA